MADPAPEGAGAERPMSIQEAQQLLQAMQMERMNLEDQQAALEGLVADLQQGERALEALEKVSEGDETLVPLGGGSFVRARVQDPGHVLTNVGSGVVIETGTADGRARLEERRASAAKALENLRGSIRRLDQQAASLEGQLRQAFAASQGQGE